MGASLPNGLVYRPDFITLNEEETLLAYIQNAPLEHPLYQDQFRAKRRHVGYGWGWNFRHNQFVRGEPLPPFLRSLQRKIAKWLGTEPRRVVEALINEYTPGSAIGWHVDKEGFDKIVGISLAGPCIMRWRPLTYGSHHPKDILAMPLEARSAYIMQGTIRWQWQHSVPPVPALRYSITFRTLPESYPL